MDCLRAIRAPIFAILIIETAALFAREFARRILLEHGYERYFAADLSYLVVPAILGAMLWPILSRHSAHVRHLFRLDALTLRVVLAGIAVGVLLRIAWWSQLVLRISTGLTPDTTLPSEDLTLLFGCPPAGVLLLGVLVMAVLVPVIEELINRGFFLSGLLHRGRWTAVLASSFLFMIHHPPGGFVAVYLAGLVFAFQYMNTGALWFSISSHATYNGLIQFDWRCVTGRWIPAGADTPLIAPAAVGAMLLMLCMAAICWLVWRTPTGAHAAPR